MQVTQADPGTRKRPGVNETSPPTCDKMKKFIRSKIDNDETSSRASPPSPSDQYVTKEKVKPEVQPPLPLEPPPPDEPPNLNIELKKEIVDPDYQSPGEDSPDSSSQESDLTSNDGDDNSKKPKPMCRDFIRGTCIRPGTCKFNHKCDISQLFGVYTFCRNFQNSVCTHPNCKYVHASVFEEQHFYRTGELPAHALAHHKKHIPPPPPPPPQEAPSIIPPVFKVPHPPPLRVRMNRPPPPISCIPTSKLEARPIPNIRDSQSPSTAPFKREWPCIDNFPGPSRDVGPDVENGQKRCRNCKYIELRFLHGEETLVTTNLLRAELMKEKREKLQKAKLEMHNQIDLLNKRREKLYSTLMTLFKPPFQTKPVTTSGPISSSNSGERQTWLLEQMSSAINSNLIPGMQEDASRHIINGNPAMSNIVAKLLQVYRQQMLTDASRKT